MKRLTVIILALIMSISMTACGPVEETNDGNKASDSGSEQQAKEPYLTEINHYVVSPADEQYMTDEKMEFYTIAMDAMFAHEDYVKLTDSYDDNLNILGYMQDNPYTVILSDFDITSDHMGMEFEYAYSAEECAEMVRFMDEEFLNIINGNIRADMNDLEKVLAIYKYFGERISYDYDWLEKYELSEDKFMYPDVTVYQALKTDKGVCHTYTYLCRFALQQLGIKCEKACADMTNGECHMWPIIWLDGKAFHIDPTWDSDGAGTATGLRYFGMTDEENIDRGMVDNWSCTIDMALDIECSDSRFSSWRDIAGYELIGDHMIRVTRESGEQEKIDLTKY